LLPLSYECKNIDGFLSVWFYVSSCLHTVVIYFLKWKTKLESKDAVLHIVIIKLAVRTYNSFDFQEKK